MWCPCLHNTCWASSFDIENFIEKLLPSPPYHLFSLIFQAYRTSSSPNTICNFTLAGFCSWCSFPLCGMAFFYLCLTEKKSCLAWNLAQAPPNSPKSGSIVLSSELSQLQCTIHTYLAQCEGPAFDPSVPLPSEIRYIHNMVVIMWFKSPFQKG